jgi:hypothetical protein
MVRKDGIRQHIAPKYLGQALEPSPDPFATEFAVLPRNRILYSPTRTAHAALAAVDDPHFVGIKQFSTQWSRHTLSSRAGQDSKTHPPCQIGGWHVITLTKSLRRHRVAALKFKRESLSLSLRFATVPA